MRSPIPHECGMVQHSAYLTARVPRCRCDQHGVKQVQVPWARAGSGFTLLFEALLMALMREMPVKAVARIVGEHDTRLWRLVDHHVGEARQRADMSQVKAIAVDENAARRGHRRQARLHLAGPMGRYPLDSARKRIYLAISSYFWGVYANLSEFGSCRI